MITSISNFVLFQVAWFAAIMGGASYGDSAFNYRLVTVTVGYGDSAFNYRLTFAVLAPCSSIQKNLILLSSYLNNKMHCH